EKILEGEENIPREWPVAGTTGYEWLNLVGDLLIHPGGWEDLVGCYRQFTGRSERGDEVVRGAKEAVLEGGLSADLTRLVDRLSAVCERHRRYRDFTRRDLRDCLRAVAVCFGVYRTYLRQGQPPSPEDVATIDAAVRQAGVSHPELDTDLLQFLRELLLGRIAGSDALEVAIRFQQLTGPVMAKAVEDTAFYRYLPLSSRNEVGGEPGHAPCGLEEFHGRAAHNHERHPDGLLALSSHDTKRSEDVRARLAVLAEIPADWGSAVRRWRSLHRSARQVALPDANTEWLFYQSLVGAWPIDVERLGDYLRKAAREAEEHTSWTDPDPVFEESLHYFVGEALGDEEFMDDVGSFVAGLRRPGWSNSLSQKLLTLTAPGVGDLYQGSECWDLSLVDPDNRRAVDYARRAAGLEKLLSSGGSLALQAWGDGDDEGLSKLLVVQRALGLRRLEPGWFAGGADGTYRPMEARGPAAAHAVAFCRGPIAREGGERSGGALSVATRLPVTLAKAGGWRDTRLDLPAGEWTDHLSGRSYEGTVELGALLEALPLALLATVGPVGE
ncbi:MAG: malto-oligosyltrehalose synthase, partial [Candidatus Aeolococcus gillhamiae]